MAEQTCKDCGGKGMLWGVDFDGANKYAVDYPCHFCQGTGKAPRTTKNGDNK